MIIKRENNNNQDKRNFTVIEYCCKEMGQEMNECPLWNVFGDMMWASDGESEIGGRFCCYCGQKIIIQ